MQASFTDLVGTAVVPAHCFDSDELTDLATALDTTVAVDCTGLLASLPQGDFGNGILSSQDRCRDLSGTLTYGWSGC